MLPPTVQIIIVNASAKSYLLISQDATKVRCKGEVLRVNGLSAMHGADKVFLKSKVTICQPQDLTEDLLHGMYWQEKPRDQRPKLPKAAKPKRPKKERGPPKWVKVTRYPGETVYELTKYAEKQFIAMGYDTAADGLEESIWQDAAFDLAAYNCDLTDEGIPEGASSGWGGKRVVREMAADMAYEGMLKWKKEQKKAAEVTR